MKNCTELNIVKHTQTCKYLGYCSQILYSSTVPFNIFSIFTKRYTFNLPTLRINLLTHAWRLCHAWCQAVLIYKMLTEEDSVLIKVLRVEKGHGVKRIMNEFTRSGAFYKSESTAAWSVTSTIYLKERLIEEWRHFHHGIIDRAVNVNQWRKRLRRFIRENGGHFSINFKRWGCSLSGLIAAALCSLIFWFCLQFDFWVWVP